MKETEFWISAKDKYPLLSAKAQRIPIQFAMSYLYETAFFGICCERKQVKCENQCGTGNKCGGVQFDSKV